MKILINDIDKKNQIFIINGISLHSKRYLHHKVNKNLIQLLKNQFSKYDIVYDIVMGISTEIGTDYYIEDMIKNLEHFYNKNLTYKEIKSVIESYNDCQNL